VSCFIEGEVYKPKKMKCSGIDDKSIEGSQQWRFLVKVKSRCGAMVWKVSRGCFILSTKLVNKNCFEVLNCILGLPRCLGEPKVFNPIS